MRTTVRLSEEARQYIEEYMSSTGCEKFSKALNTLILEHEQHIENKNILDALDKLLHNQKLLYRILKPNITLE